jgi:tetratricopeptide (TPR) repeat protein
MRPRLGGVLAQSLRKGAGAVVAGIQRTAQLDLSDRATLVASSQGAALSDSHFLALAASADALRDQQRWLEAEAAYAAALRLYPWERSYWIQRGHMAKEQGEFERAEIAYRTACALGAKPSDVAEHLRFAMARNGCDEGQSPIRFHVERPAALQVPGEPDVAAFGRLLWQVGGIADEHVLQLLRRCATCDDLVAAMCSDTRFERANRSWLELVDENEL